jgi:hypothetical protein
MLVKPLSKAQRSSGKGLAATMLRLHGKLTAARLDQALKWKIQRPKNADKTFKQSRAEAKEKQLCTLEALAQKLQTATLALMPAQGGDLQAPLALKQLERAPRALPKASRLDQLQAILSKEKIKKIYSKKALMAKLAETLKAMFQTINQD